MHDIETSFRRISENLNKLPAFLAIAQQGSVSRAAKDIHLSPSALSHLLTTLEASLGLKLFRRRSHGLELTADGLLFFAFAKRLRSDVEDFACRLNQKANSTVTKLKIGTHETLAAHIWPQAIATLTKLFPNVVLTLVTGRVDGLIHSLLREDLDLVFSVEPSPHASLTIRPIYKGRLQFFVGQGDHLPVGARAKPVEIRDGLSLKDLANVPILTDFGAHTRQGIPIPQALMAVGLGPAGPLEVSSFEAAINLAAMNLGIAILPDRNAQQAVQAKRLRPLAIRGLRSRERLQYQICLSHRTGGEHTDLYSGVANVLLALLK